MKKTQIIELLKNIRKSIVSFISISFFVMLGTGLFLGIGWSEDAFKITVNKTANDWQLHDAQVLFPYGFDEDFISSLNESQNVDSVEGVYTTEAFFKKGSNKYQAKIISLTNYINTPAKLIGVLPQKAGEIAIERFWAEKNGFLLGETIIFEHNDNGNSHALNAIYNVDTDALQNKETTKSGMKDLVTDKYVVTAFIETATYMNQYKITYGVSSSTTIPNDCIVYVTKDSFDSKSFIGYPELVISNNSIHGDNIFTNEYKDKFDLFKNNIEHNIKDYTDNKNTILQDGILKTRRTFENKIFDGERLIIYNEKKIKDGEIQIKDGRNELSKAKTQLSNAQKQIDDGYKEYYNGKDQLDKATSELNKAQETFNFIKIPINGYKNFLQEATDIKNYIEAIGDNYEAIRNEILSAPDQYVLEQFDIFYNNLHNGDYDSDITKMLLDYTVMINSIKSNEQFESFEKVLNNYEQYLITLPDGETKDKLAIIISSLQSVLNETSSVLNYPNEIFEAYKLLRQYNLDGLLENEIIQELDETFKSEGFNNFISIIQTVSEIASNEYNSFEDMVYEIYAFLGAISSNIDTITPILDSYQSEFDEAWSQISSSRAQLQQAKEQLESSESKLAQGKKEYNDNTKLLDSKQKEIEKGKIELADAKIKLQEAKEDYKELDESLNKIKPYDYNLLGRNSNGGIASTEIPSKIMGNIKYTMALLFVVVGIFVCYSALSRTVYEQTVQIGTKKALGLNNKEITIFYLAYAFIAVSIGSFLGTLLARFIIEPIIVYILAKNYIVGELLYYFSFSSSFLFFIFELTVSLLTTYLACNKILKQKATKLLTGQSDILGKQRAYEKTKFWEKLPLFTKTIINNCFNDTKRVFATLVGIAGCCSLMVCASVLYTNLNDSFEYQMNNITKFDTLIYFDTTKTQAKQNISDILKDNNIDSFPCFYSSFTLKSPEDTYLTSCFISYSSDEIFDYFEVAQNGIRENIEDGICISKAYANNYNLKHGDMISFLDSEGTEHTSPITGIFDFYLLRGQMIMSSQAYEKEFNETPTENVLLLKRGNYTTEELFDLLSNTEGFVSVFDYGKEASELYSSLTSSVLIIIITFFVLSIVLAFLVLLNLYVMFVDEKKRELIVLMINGYSRQDAKRYIYEDTIFLTIIGIIFGTIIGVLVGFATLDSFSSDCVIIMKNINFKSYLICGALTILLSFGTCLLSLKKISKFSLTDINKA